MNPDGRTALAQFLVIAVSTSSTARMKGARPMMLKNKVAVIYGAGGAIGGAARKVASCPVDPGRDA